jgi:hypothetical protein
LDLIVVLQPCAFGDRSFDPITQTFTWVIYDELDQALTLTLPFRDWTKESIRVLEQLSPPKESSWRFVVRLSHLDDELLVEPISILRDENTQNPVFQLAFDSVSQQTGTIASQSGSDSWLDDEGFQPDDESVEVVEAELPGRASLTKVINELNRRLEATAETGIRNGLAAHRDWFAQSHREVHSFGLTTLARALESLSSQTSVSSGVLLKTRFLTHLHSQATARLRE